MLRLTILIAVLLQLHHGVDGSDCTEQNTLLKFATFGKTKESSPADCLIACKGTFGCSYWIFNKQKKECESKGIKSMTSDTVVSGKKDCNLLTCESSQIDSDCIRDKTYLKSITIDTLKSVPTQKDCAEKCNLTKPCLLWSYYPKKQTCRLSGLKSNKNAAITSGKMNCFWACSVCRKGPQTTSTTTTTTTTAATTTSRLPFPCNDDDYNVFKSYRRRLDYMNVGNYIDFMGNMTNPEHERSPDWKGTGYYRFILPAGTRWASMETQTHNFDFYSWRCASHLAIGGSGRHPTEVGETTELYPIRVSGEGGLPGNWYMNYTVTKCPGDFFVYWFPDLQYRYNQPLDYTPGRYCGGVV